MPQPETQMATRWSIEAPFLAKTENHMDLTPLSVKQIDQGLGSLPYHICYKTVANQPSNGSCLGTLILESPFEAIQE